MEEFVIHMAISLVGLLIKNPSRAQALRQHLLILRDSIDQLYPDAKK